MSSPKEYMFSSEDSFAQGVRAEEFIKQTIFGIIPEELWEHHFGNKTNPFKNLSSAEVRRIKRKFRKIKRRAGVKNHYTATRMWSRINKHLYKVDPQ